MSGKPPTAKEIAFATKSVRDAKDDKLRSLRSRLKIIADNPSVNVDADAAEATAIIVEILDLHGEGKASKHYLKLAKKWLS